MAPVADSYKYMEIVQQANSFMAKAQPTYTVWETCTKVLNGERLGESAPNTMNYNIALPNDANASQQAMFQKLLEPYRTLLAKLAINIPWAAVMPATDSPDDVAKAQSAEALLQYWLQSQKFDRKMTTAIQWLLQTGNAGLYLSQHGTETRLEAISPFNILLEPDLSDPDDTRWVILRRFATKKELSALFPDKAEIIKDLPVSVDPMGQPTRSTSPGWSNQQPGDRVEYWEYCAKDGKLAFLLPDPCTVLYDGDLPEGCWPFAFIPYTPISGRCFGKGAVEPSIEPMRFYNLIRTSMLRNATLTGNPKVLVHNQDAGTANGWTDRPGQIIRWGASDDQAIDLAIPAPTYLQPPSMPAYVQNLPAEMLNEILSCMGVSAVSLGKRQANVSSGRAIEALTENSASQLAVTQQQIEFAVAHICRCALQMMKEYSNGKTMIRQLDRYGAPVYRELQMTDLSDETPEVFIDADTLFRSRAADRRNAVIADMNAGIISPEDAKEMLRSRTASMPDLAYMADLRHAKEVLEAAVALAAPVKFYPNDNLPLLQRVFSEYMRSPDFYKQPKAVQDMLDGHLDTLAQMMAAKLNPRPQGQVQQHGSRPDLPILPPEAGGPEANLLEAEMAPDALTSEMEG